MEDRIEALQLRVEELRYCGSLHPQSPLLNDLLQTRVRQCVLARLSHMGGSSGGTSKPPVAEIEAELELGRCYYDMQLWSHAVAHAKKASRLVHGAQHAGQAVDKVLRGRILCLLGEGLGRVVPQKEGCRSQHPTSAHRVLLDAAKLVGLSMPAVLGGAETPPTTTTITSIDELGLGGGKASKDHGDVYSDDGFEEDGQGEDKDVVHIRTNDNLYFKTALLQTTQAEIPEESCWLLSSSETPRAWSSHETSTHCPHLEACSQLQHKHCSLLPASVCSFSLLT
jgi:hypothetical protein